MASLGNSLACGVFSFVAESVGNPRITASYKISVIWGSFAPRMASRKGTENPARGGVRGFQGGAFRRLWGTCCVPRRVPYEHGGLFAGRC